MPRRQLLELEDQSWFPAGIRDAVTDYLQFLIELAEPYAAAAPILMKAIERTRDAFVLDLASGAGGPWRGLQRHLNQGGTHVSVCLSDMYPNSEAAKRAVASGEERVTYFPIPVDARNVPPELPGFRTLFSSFHHFSPNQARAVLHNAVMQGRGIAVFEALERRPLYLLLACLNGFLVPLLTLFIRPFGWHRLLWTYLLPVVPMVIVFDGLVSCRRAYTVEELRQMASSLEASHYTWEAGLTRSGSWPLPLTFLIGYPTASSVTD